jgi:hypothetical protein
MWNLPRCRDTTLQFFHDIWAGRKKVYFQYQISQINTPYFEELSLKSCWHYALQIPDLMTYMPSNWDLKNDGKKIDRTFFFATFHTHSPEIMRQLIHNARALRVARAHAKKEEKPQAQSVLPAALAQRMLNADFISSKYRVS